MRTMCDNGHLSGVKLLGFISKLQDFVCILYHLMGNAHTKGTPTQCPGGGDWVVACVSLI